MDSPIQPKLTSRAPVGRPDGWKKPPSAADFQFVYAPQPRQQVFHACGADVVLYGGSVGGGKSMALLAEAWMCMRETPGSYGVLMRKTFPELERSLILKSRQMFPRGLAKYNEMTHRWTIRPDKKGPDSILDFAFAKNTHEAENLYKSAEFTFLGIDEATQHEWETVVFLMSRCRTSIKGSRSRIVMATNPGGIGHFWAKNYFGIGTVEPESVFTPAPSEDDPIPMTRCFIPAKLTDNTALMENDPDYFKKLMLLPPTTRRMLLDGDWDVFEGKFFTEFTSAHLVEPFDIPKHWKVYRGVDYGYSDPFVCLWFACCPCGHYYVFREIYQRQLRDKQQAELIRSYSHEQVEFTMGDPSMHSKNSTGVSVAENYLSTAGIAVYPSSNDRIAGWMACRNMLAMHPDGTPIMRIVGSACPKLVEEIKFNVFDDKHSDDMNKVSKKDHAVDAWRYFAVSRPFAPAAEKHDPLSRLDEASRREWTAVFKKQNEVASGKNESTLQHINREEDSDNGFF